MTVKIKSVQIFFILTLVSFLFSQTVSAKMEKKMNTSASVYPQMLEKAKINNNWKVAFATASHGQVVFMNISKETNPKNEIGMETHPFDQVILVVEGNGKALLDGKTSNVQTGDMIFIPQGTSHNVVNLNNDKSLKIISFYSSNDIAANTVYQKKSDESSNDDVTQ